MALKQGQRVSTIIGGAEVTGKIVGKSLEDLPIIGGTYIIEPDVPLDNSVYDYSHFSMQEISLKLID